MKERIVTYAEFCGADLVAVAGVQVYAAYLAEVCRQIALTAADGYDYMFDGDSLEVFGKLSDPRKIFPAAKSIILLGVYAFDEQGDYRKTRQRRQGKTARTYAYYPVVRQIAEKLADFIRELGGKAIQGQQIPLKHVAHGIGLGTYGYNGILYFDAYGSYVALRAVLTDAELEPDYFTPPTLPCESCQRCLKACPTGALYAPYRVNPKYCINPLTRKDEDVPESLRPKLGNWVCGCDICQEVCPINRSLIPRAADPRAGFDPGHHASHRIMGGLSRCPDLQKLGTDTHPLMRRNAAIALENLKRSQTENHA